MAEDSGPGLVPLADFGVGINSSSSFSESSLMLIMAALPLSLHNRRRIGSHNKIPVLLPQTGVTCNSYTE